MKGFTVIEFIIALMVFITLFALVNVNLLRFSHQTSLASQTDTIISDLNYHKLKAMSADTEGRIAPSAYGIYFESNRYILFHGSSYTDSEPSNYTVNLDDNLVIADIAFPGGVVVFARGSGEIAGFTDGLNTLTLKNLLSNEEKIITLNRYGVVTGVN